MIFKSFLFLRGAINIYWQSFSSSPKPRLLMVQECHSVKPLVHETCFAQIMQTCTPPSGFPENFRKPTPSDAPTGACPHSFLAVKKRCTSPIMPSSCTSIPVSYVHIVTHAIEQLSWQDVHNVYILWPNPQQNPSLPTCSSRNTFSWPRCKFTGQ